MKSDIRDVKNEITVKLSVQDIEMCKLKRRVKKSVQVSVKSSRGEEAEKPVKLSVQDLEM